MAGRSPCSSGLIAMIVANKCDPPAAYSSPVAATATPVSSAAEQQHEYDDNQDHLHWKPPFKDSRLRSCCSEAFILDFGDYLYARKTSSFMSTCVGPKCSIMVRLRIERERISVGQRPTFLPELSSPGPDRIRALPLRKIAGLRMRHGCRPCTFALLPRSLHRQVMSSCPLPSRYCRDSHCARFHNRGKSGSSPSQGKR
jgi:hypothetical protein